MSKPPSPGGLFSLQPEATRPKDDPDSPVRPLPSRRSGSLVPRPPHPGREAQTPLPSAREPRCEDRKGDHTQSPAFAAGGSATVGDASGREVGIKADAGAEGLQRTRGSGNVNQYLNL